MSYLVLFNSFYLFKNLYPDKSSLHMNIPYINIGGCSVTNLHFQWHKRTPPSPDTPPTPSCGWCCTGPWHPELTVRSHWCHHTDHTLSDRPAWQPPSKGINSAPVINKKQLVFARATNITSFFCVYKGNISSHESDS